MKKKLIAIGAALIVGVSAITETVFAMRRNHTANDARQLKDFLLGKGTDDLSDAD